MIPTLEERQCDRATIHVRINDLLKGNLNVSPDRICNDILEIALLCRNYNIGKTFIWSLAYSTKSNSELLRQLNGMLCITYLEYLEYVISLIMVQYQNAYLDRWNTSFQKWQNNKCKKFDR